MLNSLDRVQRCDRYKNTGAMRAECHQLFRPLDVDCMGFRDLDNLLRRLFSDLGFRAQGSGSHYRNV